METLTIGSSRPLTYNSLGVPERIPRLTFRSLATVAANCPLLNPLTLSINASADLGVLSEPIILPHLEYLDFGSSWIITANIGKVLSLLVVPATPHGCLLCPGKVAHGTPDDDRQRVEGWIGVISGLQRLREQSQAMNITQQEQTPGGFVGGKSAGDV